MYFRTANCSSRFTKTRRWSAIKTVHLRCNKGNTETWYWLYQLSLLIIASVLRTNNVMSFDHPGWLYVLRYYSIVTSLSSYLPFVVYCILKQLIHCSFQVLKLVVFVVIVRGQNRLCLLERNVSWFEQILKIDVAYGFYSVSWHFYVTNK